MFSSARCSHFPWLRLDFLFNIEYLFAGVKYTTPQSSALLRERFVLQFALMMKPLFSSKFLASKEVIPFVWDDTSEASLSTYFANFWWVRQKVSWSRNDCTLFVSVVLHDFSPVRHVFEWWLVVLLDDLGWCKVLLVASC